MIADAGAMVVITAAAIGAVRMRCRAISARWARVYHRRGNLVAVAFPGATAPPDRIGRALEERRCGVDRLGRREDRRIDRRVDEPDFQLGISKFAVRPKL
jgi:hypothetical protein